MIKLKNVVPKGLALKVVRSQTGGTLGRRGRKTTKLVRRASEKSHNWGKHFIHPQTILYMKDEHVCLTGLPCEALCSSSRKLISNSLCYAVFEVAFLNNYCVFQDQSWLPPHPMPPPPPIKKRKHETWSNALHSLSSGGRSLHAIYWVACCAYIEYSTGLILLLNQLRQRAMRCEAEASHAHVVYRLHSNLLSTVWHAAPITQCCIHTRK